MDSILKGGGKNFFCKEIFFSKKTLKAAIPKVPTTEQHIKHQGRTVVDQTISKLPCATIELSIGIELTNRIQN